MVLAVASVPSGLHKGQTHRGLGIGTEEEGPPFLSLPVHLSPMEGGLRPREQVLCLPHQPCRAQQLQEHLCHLNSWTQLAFAPRPPLQSQLQTLHCKPLPDSVPHRVSALPPEAPVKEGSPGRGHSRRRAWRSRLGVEFRAQKRKSLGQTESPWVPDQPWEGGGSAGSPDELQGQVSPVPEHRLPNRYPCLCPSFPGITSGFPIWEDLVQRAGI